MSASWQVHWISSVLARRELSRLAPDILVRTLLIVGVGEFLAMLLFQFLHVRMGLWAAFLDVFVLTLVTSGPLYWLVLRPAARLATRAAAASAEAHFQAVVEAVSDAIVITEADGAIAFANPAAEPMFGFELKKLLGWPLSVLLPRRSRPGRTEAEGCRRDGSRFPAEVSTRVVVIGERELRVILVRDITRRRQAEWELARLASFPRLDPNPLFECDAEGSVTYANPAALRLLQSLGGPEPAARLLPQNLPALVRACLGGCDDRCQAETPVDGRTLLWSLYALPESQRVRLYGVDITQRQRAEEALRESEERFRLLVEALPVAVRVIQGGRLRFTNPSGAALFGYRHPDEMRELNGFDHVAEEDAPRLREYMAKLAAGEEAPTRYEFRARRRDGSLFPAEAAVARISYRGRHASLVVLLDLTERKRLRLFESLLPVCCLCGKVRDDTKTKRGHGSWRALEEYVVEHSDADLTHTFCPDCYRTYRVREGLPPAEFPHSG